MLDRTRLTVPIETGRAASVSSDYLDFAAKHAAGDQDDFTRSCINAGVHLGTSTAFDKCVTRVLRSWKNRDPQRLRKWASLSWRNTLIRSTLFDTGANGSINFRDVERYLYSARKTELDIAVANKSKLDVGLDGLLPISVVNTA